MNSVKDQTYFDSLYSNNAGSAVYEQHRPKIKHPCDDL